MIIIGIVTLVGYFVVLNRLRQLMEPFDVVFKLLDLITVSIPPALPFALTVGIMVSLNNLKEMQINCISPQRVVDGGAINTICFDKTGTLTEN